MALPLRVSGGQEFLRCLRRHPGGSAGESRLDLCWGVRTPQLAFSQDACNHACVHARRTTSAAAVCVSTKWWGPLRLSSVLRGGGVAGAPPTGCGLGAIPTPELTIPRGFDSRHFDHALILHAVLPPVKRRGSSFVPKTRLVTTAEGYAIQGEGQQQQQQQQQQNQQQQQQNQQQKQQQQQQEEEEDAAAAAAAAAAGAAAVIRVRQIDRELFFSKGQLESICAFLRRHPCRYVVISCTSSSRSSRSSSRSSSGSEVAVSQQQRDRLEMHFSSAVFAAHGGAISGVCTPEKESFIIEVLDRTQLVLEIFSRRANDSLARLQVALACTKRLAVILGSGRLCGSQLSRAIRSLANHGAEAPWLSRFQASVQGGTDPRRTLKELRKMQQTLNAKLALEKRQRMQLAPNREGLPVVGLVGYSSSGKTSLLNYLCACNEPSGPSLCMTLGVVQRRARLGGSPMVGPRGIGYSHGAPFLVLDSVGFVEGVDAAARAIIEEGLEEVVARSSLLLLLVDPLHPRWRERRQHALRLILRSGLRLRTMMHANAAAANAAIAANAGNAAAHAPHPKPPAELSTQRHEKEFSDASLTSSTNSNNSNSGNSFSNSWNGNRRDLAARLDVLGAGGDASSAAVHAKFGARVLEVLQVAFEQLEGRVEAIVDFSHETAGSLMPYLHRHAYVIPSSLTETEGGRLSVNVVASRDLLARVTKRFLDVRMHLPPPPAAGIAAAGAAAAATTIPAAATTIPAAAATPAAPAPPAGAAGGGSLDRYTSFVSSPLSPLPTQQHQQQQQQHQQQQELQQRHHHQQQQQQQTAASAALESGGFV
ncbi:hypothetical protein ACSSS7_007636 [Eimeria intestinalis]